MATTHTRLKKISIETLIRMVKNGDPITNCSIIEKINLQTLKELIHYDSIRQEYIFEYPLIIQNCTIESIDLNSIHFNNKFEMRYSFIKNASFDYSYFMKGANFNSSTFEKAASFYQCSFYHFTYFSNCHFTCDARFDLCYFGDHLFFRSAHFKSNGSFHSCSFKKRTLFTHLLFDKLDFKASRFHDYFKISNLENAIAPSDLESHKTRSIILLTGVHFYDLVDLNKIDCQFIDFSNSISKDIIELSHGKFVLIGLDNFKFDTMYIELNQIYTQKKTYTKPHFHIMNSENVRSMKRILTNLKNNYQKLGWYKEEDWIYRQLKMVELKEKKENHKFFQYLAGKYVLNLFFGFGTMPFRVFLSALFLIFFYGLLYTAYGINSLHGGIFHSNFKIPSLLDYFYFSAITFTTVGYGDMVPTAGARFIAATEGFLGTFMMSAFTVTFARKLIR